MQYCINPLPCLQRSSLLTLLRRSLRVCAHVYVCVCVRAPVCVRSCVCMRARLSQRDPWCQLDFVVVVVAWLPVLFPSMGSYSVLRAFRALRPLRALKRLPGMPLLVQWILDVLPKMGNVLMLFTFAFLVFGIVGMELFKGALHYRCAKPGWERLLAQQLPAGGGPAGGGPAGGGPAGGGSELLLGSPAAVLGTEFAEFDTGLACAYWLAVDGEGGVGGAGGAGGAAGAAGAGGAGGSSSGDAAGVCHEGSSCMYFASNPNHGIQSFDSVLLTFITLVQATSFDDWAEPMYALMTTVSPFVWIYFVLTVLVGGFFVANLFLAVVFLEFAASQDRVLEAEESGEHMWSPLNSDGDGSVESHRDRTSSPISRSRSHSPGPPAPGPPAREAGSSPGSSRSSPGSSPPDLSPQSQRARHASLRREMRISGECLGKGPTTAGAAAAGRQQRGRQQRGRQQRRQRRQQQTGQQQARQQQARRRRQRATRTRAQQRPYRRGPWGAPSGGPWGATGTRAQQRPYSIRARRATAATARPHPAMGSAAPWRL